MYIILSLDVYTVDDSTVFILIKKKLIEVTFFYNLNIAGMWPSFFPAHRRWEELQVLFSQSNVKKICL